MLVGAAPRGDTALLGPHAGLWARESGMAACNGSFTASCLVHFLNNTRTFPPSPPLPLVPLCYLRSIISQLHLSKPAGGQKYPSHRKLLCVGPMVTCFCLSLLLVASHLETESWVPLCPAGHSPPPLLVLSLTLSLPGLHQLRELKKLRNTPMWDIKLKAMKILKTDHVKVSKSVAFSTFIYNHYFYPAPKHFHHSKRRASYFLFSSPPASWQPPTGYLHGFACSRNST